VVSSSRGVAPKPNGQGPPGAPGRHLAPAELGIRAAHRTTGHSVAGAVAVPAGKHPSAPWGRHRIVNHGPDLEAPCRIRALFIEQYAKAEHARHKSARCPPV